MPSTPEIMDLAVAGAGVSGLFSAWRLLDHGARQGKPLSVTVFESDDRVGGRLLSVKPPFIHDTYVELGGMRFSKSHRLAHDLIRSLGLAYKELADANPNNVAYLRGTRTPLASTPRRALSGCCRPSMSSPAVSSSLTTSPASPCATSRHGGDVEIRSWRVDL